MTQKIDIYRPGAHAIWRVRIAAAMCPPNSVYSGPMSPPPPMSTEEVEDELRKRKQSEQLQPRSVKIRDEALGINKKRRPSRRQRVSKQPVATVIVKAEIKVQVCNLDWRATSEDVDRLLDGFSHVSHHMVRGAVGDVTVSSEVIFTTMGEAIRFIKLIDGVKMNEFRLAVALLTINRKGTVMRSPMKV